MKDMELKRVNIRIPACIQEFYKEQGEKYSVPYTNYMAMILTQNYEKEEDKKFLREFSNVVKQIKQMKEMSGNVSAEEVMIQLKEMIEMVKKL